MPKAQKHFDDVALLRHVQEQDVGLVVSTNDPAGLRRILYATMRAAPHLRARIFQSPKSARRFLLVKLGVIMPASAGEELSDDDAADDVAVEDKE